MYMMDDEHQRPYQYQHNKYIYIRNKGKTLSPIRHRNARHQRKHQPNERMSLDKA
jgi:hypothetical protein